MNFKKIFRSEQNWTQNAYARDKFGNAIDINILDQDDSRAMGYVQSWSLYGALAFFISYEKFPDLRDKTRVLIRKAIEEYTGKTYSIAEYNNLKTTTFKDIQNIIAIVNRLKSNKTKIDEDYGN